VIVPVGAASAAMKDTNGLIRGSSAGKKERGDFAKGEQAPIECCCASLLHYSRKNALGA